MKQKEEVMHVHDFIGYGTSIKNRPENEDYARWVLDYFAGSAITQSVFEPFMKDHLLFCQYEGEKYRVTGCSRLGDVWLTKDFNQSTGYQKRVMVEGLSGWSKD